MENTAASVAMVVTFTARLGSVASWLAIAVAHALLLSLASLALWAFQVLPQDAWGWLVGIATAKATAVLTLLSGGSLLAVWWLAMRALARAIHGRLGEFVVR